jgi:hypothetical protein
MNEDSNLPTPQAEDRDRWGVIVLLLFLIGIPVVSLIYSLLVN